MLPVPITAFSPRSRVQLKSAVDACLKMSPKGKCLKGTHGPIGTWDVSRVTDMSRMFSRAKVFDSDISKWDVSRVNDMHSMFLGAAAFKQTLCTNAWVHSKASKDYMFEGSPGSLSSTVCTKTNDFSPQSSEDLKKAVNTYLGCYHVR